MASGDFYPFLLQKRVTLDSLGAGQVQFQIGSTERFVGEKIDFIVSSGTFNIIDMKDSGGKGYTDANASNPLSSAYFLTTLDQRRNNDILYVPLALEPSMSFSISFSGGTASATIDVTIAGKKQSV